jgi:ectoine hydroxylase-related dioxygenase (phytanoyl-CoA dioxygenase family)
VAAGAGFIETPYMQKAAANPDKHGVPVPIGAGSVVLFSAWTWHHSKHNRTHRVRRALIVSYQEATLPKGAGEQWKILRPAASIDLSIERR